MRGRTERQAEMLVAVSPEDFIPRGHPIRRIREIVDVVLARLSPEFNGVYAPIGRPSVPPEHLIKATLLMAFYSVRSERQFCERLQYDLLFKWFVGLTINEAVFDPTSFTKNRERLLKQDIAVLVLGEVVEEARRRKLLSEDHFSVDGTLLQAWASLKSIRPRDEQEDPPAGSSGGRNREVDFHGQRRRNATHVSRTDPEAKLARKGNAQEARLSYSGHILVENRNGFIVDALLSEATGTAERDAALQLLERQGIGAGATLGADKGYAISLPPSRRWGLARTLPATPATGRALCPKTSPQRRTMPSASGGASSPRNLSGGLRRWPKAENCAPSVWRSTSSGSSWRSRLQPCQTGQTAAAVRLKEPEASSNASRSITQPPNRSDEWSSPSHSPAQRR